MTRPIDRIATELESAAATEDWSRFELAVIAGSRAPHPAYLNVLIDVVGRRVDDLNYGDVIDLLGRIGDPRAVGAIENALMWQNEGDEFEGLAITCVWALGAIGTPAARTVLMGIVETGSERLRSFARSELDRA